MFKSKDLEGLVKLFTFTKKRQLEVHARGRMFHGSDLAALIMACDVTGQPFSHRAYFKDCVPQHLIPLDSGLSAIAKNRVGPLGHEAQRTVRKMFQLFEERRYVAGHIFYTSDLQYWHFFRFDQRDTEQQRKNHWKDGAHIHFVNWLWPDLYAELVWSVFVQHLRRPARSLHLRFLH